MKEESIQEQRRKRENDGGIFSLVTLLFYPFFITTLFVGDFSANFGSWFQNGLRICS